MNHYNGYDLFYVLMHHKVPFIEGNIIKYVWRWRGKDGIKDLKKAKDYLDRLIEDAEEEEKARAANA